MPAIALLFHAMAPILCLLTFPPLPAFSPGLLCLIYAIHLSGATVLLGRLSGLAALMFLPAINAVVSARAGRHSSFSGISLAAGAASIHQPGMAAALRAPAHAHTRASALPSRPCTTRACSTRTRRAGYTSHFKRTSPRFLPYGSPLDRLLRLPRLTHALPAWQQFNTTRVTYALARCGAAPDS